MEIIPFKTGDDLVNFVTELSKDFDDILNSQERQNIFIAQVCDYAEGCCETEQELLCFVDGYLMNF